jgi:hypothetical protein
MKLRSRLVAVVLGFVYAGAAEPVTSQYNRALEETPAVSGYDLARIPHEFAKRNRPLLPHRTAVLSPSTGIRRGSILRMASSRARINL